jgi:hypothetical protein
MFKKSGRPASCENTKAMLHVSPVPVTMIFASTLTEQGGGEGGVGQGEH